MRQLVSVTAMATGLGLLLAAGPVAAAQSGGVSAEASGPAMPIKAVANSDGRGDVDGKELFAEMQAEGLIAAKTAGWTVPPPRPSPAGRAGKGSARAPQPPSPPEGVRKSPCPSP